MHVSGDREAVREIRERWASDLNRKVSDPDYKEEWYSQQCGACAFWFPLAGKLGSDYGACANGKSPFNGRVRFEHDGCAFYVDAGQWIVAEEVE